MRALGHASLFGATSLTAKAAASSVRKGAHWIARKGTDFIYRSATPEQEPPAARTVTDDTFRKVAPTEFREYILPLLMWPTRKGGIWHPSTPGKVQARRAHLPCYCATSSCPLSRSQTKRPSKTLSEPPPARTLQRPLSWDDTILEARDEAKVLHFARHPIGPLVLGHSSRYARHRRP